MDLFKNLRESKNNWLQEWQLLHDLEKRDKLVNKGKNLFEMMDEEQKTKAKEQILLNLLGNIEQEISNFLLTTNELGILTSEEEIRKIWKRVERDIVESPIYKNDIMEWKEFLKGTFPKMIDIICITLNTKSKRLWKLLN